MGNKHGLSRKIPNEVKRTVRQRCGFGCVRCGSAVYEYHHFAPPFARATRHDPGGITLLCAGCHDDVTRGLLRESTILKANKNPICLQRGFAHKMLDVGDDANLPICIGSSRIHAATAVRYDDVVLLGLSPPERLGGPARLNALFTDDGGREMLIIQENEAQVGIRRFDIECSRNRLLIRKKQGSIILAMGMSIENEIVLTKLHMSYKGFRIDIEEGVFTFRGPGGWTYQHNGESFGGVGIWMRSDGSTGFATPGPERELVPKSQAS